MIYSEDPTGRSLTYIKDDSGRLSKVSQESSEPMIIYDSKWYQKARQASTEPRRGYPRVQQESEDPIIIYDSRWYPKDWKESKNNKETLRYVAQLRREKNPNLCSPDKWKRFENKLPHTSSDAIGIYAHFKRNKCRHGLSGRFPVGKHRECEAIHPQLCWQFLRHGQGKTGCPSGANCGHLHPRICQESWKTGKCDKGGLCGDGYHLGDRIGKPKIKYNYGTPMGTTEGPRQFMIRNHGG